MYVHTGRSQYFSLKCARAPEKYKILMNFISHLLICIYQRFLNSTGKCMTKNNTPTQEQVDIHIVYMYVYIYLHIYCMLVC